MSSSAPGSMRFAGMRLPGNGVRSAGIGIGRRVVDRDAGAAEVAAPQAVGGEAVGAAGRVCAALRALPVREEEQLVLDDRPADVAAELVQRVRRALRRWASGRVARRADRLVGVVAPGRAARARSCPTSMITLIAAPPAMPCSALKELVTMLTLPDGFGGGHVGGVGGEPGVDDAGAIEPRVVLQARDAVDVERDRSLRAAGGVLLAGHHAPGTSVIRL